VALPTTPEPDPLDEIRQVVDDYLIPASLELKRSADDGDVDALRAYAFELLAATGTVVAACPRPRTAK
jgi:hypothetical protein